MVPHRVKKLWNTPKDFGKDGGLLNLPVPISTPGYDNGPYLTSAAFITKDPETGARNTGVYRGLIKGPDTVAMQFSTKFKGRQHPLAESARTRRSVARRDRHRRTAGCCLHVGHARAVRSR